VKEKTVLCRLLSKVIAKSAVLELATKKGERQLMLFLICSVTKDDRMPFSVIFPVHLSTG
jgi:hypothetical protein